jgi:hypothetical protein
MTNLWSGKGEGYCETKFATLLDEDSKILEILRVLQANAHTCVMSHICFSLVSFKLAVTSLACLLANC